MGREAILGASALALLAAAPAVAQERPPDEEMFGAPSAASQPAAPAPAPGRPSEPEILGEAGPPRLEITKDTLKIGGMLYLRTQVYGQQGVPASAWPLDDPNLVDAYLDVRPNDRVRGFVLGRLLFDPNANPNALSVTGIPQSTYTGIVDQAWIRFDVERAVFVTAGRQHVKWGVGHFWNPTDYLHRLPRDPLAAFDARAGTTMVKVNVPWEKKGWNFYGMALLEGTNAVSQLGSLGAGARAEVVLGTVEIGVDGFVQRNQGVPQAAILPGQTTPPTTDPGPRLGVDFSAGIWELDLYGEAALKWGSEFPRWRDATPDLPLGQGSPDRYQASAAGFSPQVVAGATWSWKYSDEDSLTLGAEYFHNSLGYSSPAIYPWLIGNRDYTPFYVGERYAGVYLLLPKPGSWNSTDFVLSTLGNLSDRTFVTRLDYDVLLLTFLRFEAFAAVHYGRRGGEFRFAGDFPAIPGVLPLPISIQPAILDLGLALRVSL